MDYTQASLSLNPSIVYLISYCSNVNMDTLCFTREEGRAIQHELSEISDIEKQAVGV